MVDININLLLVDNIIGIWDIHINYPVGWDTPPNPEIENIDDLAIMGEDEELDEDEETKFTTPSNDAVAPFPSSTQPTEHVNQTLSPLTISQHENQFIKSTQDELDYTKGLLASKIKELNRLKRKSKGGLTQDEASQLSLLDNVNQKRVELAEKDNILATKRLTQDKAEVALKDAEIEVEGALKSAREEADKRVKESRNKSGNGNGNGNVPTFGQFFSQEELTLAGAIEKLKEMKEQLHVAKAKALQAQKTQREAERKMHEMEQKLIDAGGKPFHFIPYQFSMMIIDFFPSLCKLYIFLQMMTRKKRRRKMQVQHLIQLSHKWVGHSINK